ncbi:putative cation/calcium exchanger 5-like [Capsicum annuum]|nr:putative cation/calcium exchanger 5-like [Capsicum annuum]
MEANVAFYSCRASQLSLPNYGETNDINAGSVPIKASRTSSSKHINSQQHAGGQPAMVFFPACPAREEWDNLMNHANGGAALSGSALLGKVWPLIGLVDIAESEDAYVFRFSLSGVSKDESKFYE